MTHRITASCFILAFFLSHCKTPGKQEDIAKTTFTQENVKKDATMISWFDETFPKMQKEFINPNGLLPSGFQTEAHGDAPDTSYINTTELEFFYSRDEIEQLNQKSGLRIIYNPIPESQIDQRSRAMVRSTCHKSSREEENAEEGAWLENKNGERFNIVQLHCPPFEPYQGMKQSSRVAGVNSISKIVLHNTLERFDDTVNIFSHGEPLYENWGAARKHVSIHFIIARNGVVARNIIDSVGAHHAPGANLEAIGIEIEANTGIEAFSGHPGSRLKVGGMTEVQFVSLHKLLIFLVKKYNIDIDAVNADYNILSHHSVSGSLCPGSIWDVQGEGNGFDHWKESYVPILKRDMENYKL